MYRFDPRHFDLCARARWVEAGKPLHFSVLGHSVIGQAFQRADPNRYRTDRPLWREGSTDKWLEMDNRFHGAFTQAEGRVLLASVAPWAGLVRCPSGPLRRAWMSM